MDLVLKVVCSVLCLVLRVVGVDGVVEVCVVVSVVTSVVVVGVVVDSVIVFNVLGSVRQISFEKSFISNETHLSNSRGTSTEYLLANRISVLVVVMEFSTLLGITIPVVMNCPFNSLNPIPGPPLAEVKAIRSTPDDKSKCKCPL